MFFFSTYCIITTDDFERHYCDSSYAFHRSGNRFLFAKLFYASPSFISSCHRRALQKCGCMVQWQHASLKRDVCTKRPCHHLDFPAAKPVTAAMLIWCRDTTDKCRTKDKASFGSPITFHSEMLSWRNIMRNFRIIIISWILQLRELYL